MANEQGARNLAIVVYALQTAALFTVGLTLLVAVIINYVKRDVAAGTWVDSHFTWQIHTFWWNLVGTIIGTGTMFLFGLGYIVLGVVWIWLFYRIAKGWLRLVENESI